MRSSSTRPSSPTADPPITSRSRASVSPREDRPASTKAMTASIAAFVQLGALGEGARTRPCGPAPSSARVPPAPSRSSLSTARRTESFWPASLTPATVSRPSSSLRLLILTTKAPVGEAGGGVALHRHGDDLGVGLRAGGADGVGVALDELAALARTRLLVAPHRTIGVAAEGLGQGLPVLGREAGERRGQVVAQRHPLLVVVLQGEHAFVGAVGVGQELAEGVGIFEGPGVQQLEAVAIHRPSTPLPGCGARRAGPRPAGRKIRAARARPVFGRRMEASGSPCGAA